MFGGIAVSEDGVVSVSIRSLELAHGMILKPFVSLRDQFPASRASCTSLQLEPQCREIWSYHSRLRQAGVKSSKLSRTQPQIGDKFTERPIKLQCPRNRVMFPRADLAADPALFHKVSGTGARRKAKYDRTALLLTGK